MVGAEALLAAVSSRMGWVWQPSRADWGLLVGVIIVDDTVLVEARSAGTTGSVSAWLAGGGDLGVPNQADTIIDGKTEAIDPGR